MARWLLLLCAVCGFTAATDCWGASKSFTDDPLQLTLHGPDFAVASGHQDGSGTRQCLGSGASTKELTYELEYSIDDLLADDQGLNLPSGHAGNSTSVKLLLKRYCNKIGIPAPLAAGFEGFGSSNSHEIDDALVGGLIGVASSYVFAEPYSGWHVKVEGDTRNVSLNLKLAW